MAHRPSMPSPEEMASCRRLYPRPASPPPNPPRPAPCCPPAQPDRDDESTSNFHAKQNLHGDCTRHALIALIMRDARYRHNTVGILPERIRTEGQHHRKGVLLHHAPRRCTAAKARRAPAQEVHPEPPAAAQAAAVEAPTRAIAEAAGRARNLCICRGSRPRHAWKACCRVHIVRMVAVRQMLRFTPERSASAPRPWSPEPAGRDGLVKSYERSLLYLTVMSGRFEY